MYVLVGVILSRMAGEGAHGGREGDLTSTIKNFVLSIIRLVYLDVHYLVLFLDVFLIYVYLVYSLTCRVHSLL